MDRKLGIDLDHSIEEDESGGSLQTNQVQDGYQDLATNTN